MHAVRGACDPTIDDLLALGDAHAIVLVPLVFQGAGEGVLSCCTVGPEAFRPEQVRTLEQLAPHLALLIRTSRLEAEKGRIAERRARLAAWAADVMAAPDLDAAIERICEASRALFRASRSAIFLVEEGGLAARGTSGDLSRAGLSGLRLDGASPFDAVLHSGETLAINDFVHSAYAETAAGRALRPKAALFVPLIDGGGALGVLTVSDGADPFRFGPNDLEDARLLGAVATVAMRKGILLEALQRSNTAKTEFLASVSHDLRTPLNVMLGYTQLLAEGSFGPVTAQQTDTLERMERTAMDQLALINDLLDLVGIEQGKLAYSLAPVHVGEIAAPLREMMEALLRGRPVSFEVDVASDAVARTDRERLRQVLVNLLANAAKFTREGRVRLVASRGQGVIDIAIEDTGPGIESGIEQIALEPFVRGTRPAAGSGLGLAIVSRLLHALGGGIAIDSEPGRGTCVRVRLPAETPA
jgi:signal transduction histidine kinase